MSSLEPEQAQRVVAALDLHREELASAVAEFLSQALPMVGLDPAMPDRAAQHRERMRSTAQRFHQLVQLGVTADWSLVSYEFSWTAAVLGRMGITWDHQLTLIDAYFEAARALGGWSADDLAALAQIAAQFRSVGAKAYTN